jgi:hypothetical protein
MRRISICWSASTWRVKAPISASAALVQQLPDHRQRALVMAGHVAQGELVELVAAWRS